MTVTTRKYFTDWFVANGINKDWGFDFTILSQEDVIVQVRTGLDDTTIVEYTTDLGFFPADDFASGTVRYPVLGAAVPTGKYVRLVREVAYLQKEQIGKEGRFSPLTHEKAFDKLTILAQQTDNNLDLAIKVQIGGTPLQLVASMPDGAVLMKQGSFIVEGPNATSINSAQGFATQAQIARDLAEDWATNPEDTPVVPGFFSAYHWSAKSAASASAANAAKTAAEAAQSAISTEIMQSRVPVGCIIYVATTVIPAGYLLCDGSPVTSLYPDLRALLIAAGSPFGTSGSDPRLPELRGEFIRGFDGGRGIDAGRVFGSSQLDQMQGHEHAFKYGNAPGTIAEFVLAVATQSGAGVGALTNSLTNTDGGNAFSVSNAITDGTNGTPRVGSETRSRNIAMTPCIKAFGAVNPAGMADLVALLNAIASQAEAELGTNNTKIMTPLRTRQAVAAYNRWETIRDLDLAGVTAINIPDLSAFRALRISGVVKPVTNGALLLAQGSTDNGGSWLSGIYVSHYVRAVESTVTGLASSGQTAIVLADDTNNTWEAAFDHLITNFNKVSAKYRVGNMAYISSAGANVAGSYHGRLNTNNAAAWNALRVYINTGTIASGQIHIEGIRG